jgi:hypothetical protein
MVAEGTFLGGKSRGLHIVGFTLATDSCCGASAHPDSQQGGVSQGGVALPFTLKCILISKEELWKLIYFTTIPNNNLQKCLLNQPKPFKIL